MIFTFFHLYDSLGGFLILYFFIGISGQTVCGICNFISHIIFFNQLDYSFDFNIRRSLQSFSNTAENSLESRISYKKTDSGFPEPVP